MSNFVQTWIRSPLLGYAATLLLLVIGWRMTATLANLILVAAWVLFVTSVFRTAPIASLARRARIFSTAIFASVAAIALYFVLWTPSIPKHEPQLYVMHIEVPPIRSNEPFPVKFHLGNSTGQSFKVKAVLHRYVIEGLQPKADLDEIAAQLWAKDVEKLPPEELAMPALPTSWMKWSVDPLSVTQINEMKKGTTALILMALLRYPAGAREEKRVELCLIVRDTNTEFQYCKYHN